MWFWVWDRDVLYLFGDANDLDACVWTLPLWFFNFFLMQPWMLDTCLLNGWSKVERLTNELNAWFLEQLILDITWIVIPNTRCKQM
jgi:hypothetical protein